jgi:class 3 adenylate cyclase
LIKTMTRLLAHRGAERISPVEAARSAGTRGSVADSVEPSASEAPPGDAPRAGAAKPSPRLFLAPHLGHITGGFATTLYFHYLDPGSYGGPGEAGAVSPPFLLFIVVLAAAAHTLSGILHNRRLKRIRELQGAGSGTLGPAERDALAYAVFAIPGSLLRDTVAIWVVMGTAVTAFATVAQDIGLARILQIFFGTTLVGGSIANLTGYLIADALVRLDAARLLGSLESLAHRAPLKLPRLLLAFLLIVGLLPVTVAAWLAFGYGRLLAGDPVAADLVTRLTRAGVFIWFVTVAITAVSMVWIVRGMIRPLNRLTEEIGRVARGDFHIRLPVASDDDIGQIASSFNRMAGELAERERIREMFGRYVSEGVLDQLLKGELELRLGGERREVAILFADIRGFTSLAEALPPEQTTEIVNAYFEAITSPIHAEAGTIVEYLGDGVLAVFGAPIAYEDASERAVRASIQIRHAVSALKARHRETGLPAPEVGMGIHHGPVVVGNIGSSTRMKYGVIGDTVNVAARIQGLTREWAAAILISEAVRRRLGDGVAVAALGAVHVKGRTDAVQLYRVN